MKELFCEVDADGDIYSTYQTSLMQREESLSKVCFMGHNNIISVGTLYE
jgi:hypothetical protein